MKIYVMLLVLSLALGCIAPETTGPQTAGPQTGGDAAAEPGLVQAGQAAPDAGYIRIPLSELSGTARHYSYDAGGTTVRFFAVKGSDGTVRTAFDACEVCYRAGKGYSQSGSDMVCNNCGLRFKIDDLGTKNRGGGGMLAGVSPQRGRWRQHSDKEERFRGRGLPVPMMPWFIKHRSGDAIR